MPKKTQIATISLKEKLNQEHVASAYFRVEAVSGRKQKEKHLGMTETIKKVCCSQTREQQDMRLLIKP